MLVILEEEGRGGGKIEGPLTLFYDTPEHI